MQQMFKGRLKLVNSQGSPFESPKDLANRLFGVTKLHPDVRNVALETIKGSGKLSYIFSIGSGSSNRLVKRYNSAALKVQENVKLKVAVTQHSGLGVCSLSDFCHF